MLIDVSGLRRVQLCIGLHCVTGYTLEVHWLWNSALSSKFGQVTHLQPVKSFVIPVSLPSAFTVLRSAQINDQTLVGHPPQPV